MNLSDSYMTSLSLWGTLFTAGALIVDHLRVLTEGFPWLTLCDWSEKYGKATLSHMKLTTLNTSNSFNFRRYITIIRSTKIDNCS